MILVDTGFLLALLDARDALHDRARAWALHIKDQLLVTEYVLWETVNFASAPANRAKVHALVGHIRSHAGYEVVAAATNLLDAGLRLHESRSDKDWSLTDCRFLRRHGNAANPACLGLRSSFRIGRI